MKKNVRKILMTLGLATTMFLTGCGNSNKTSNVETEKIFRFAQANPKLGLDMQLSTNSGSSSIASSIVEPLLKWTEDNELIPLLITGFPTVSEDGLTYSFELKEGVKFHNGATLTSEDVKFTFERMFNPETGAKSTYMYDMIKGAKEMLAGEATELSGFKIEDDRHFTIEVTEPNAVFVKNLGIDYAGIFPKEACEEAGENWGKGTDIIGTGPYKIESNDDTTKVVLVRNDEYHGGTPNLDKVEVLYIDDANTKLLEYEKGNIDACDLPADLLQQYKNNDEFKDEINYYSSLGTFILNLNLNNEDLSDEKVREAISLAINREELVKTILNESGIVASGFLNANIPGFDESEEPYEYNPEKAKELLKEAGKENLKLTAKIRSRDQLVMVALQGYLQNIGITLDVQIIDNGVWSSEWAEGSIDATLVGWYPLYADADNQMYSYFYSDSAKSKSSFYNNPEFDALMLEARQISDEDKRTELYKKANNILSLDDYGTIPLYYPISQFMAKPYVKNMKVGNLIYRFYDIDIDLEAKNK